MHACYRLYLNDTDCLTFREIAIDGMLSSATLPPTHTGYSELKFGNSFEHICPFHTQKDTNSPRPGRIGLHIAFSTDSVWFSSRLEYFPKVMNSEIASKNFLRYLSDVPEWMPTVIRETFRHFKDIASFLTT